MAVLVSGGLGVLVRRAEEVTDQAVQASNWPLVPIGNAPYLSWRVLVLFRISQIWLQMC